MTFSKKTLSLVELDVPTNLTAKYHSTGPNFTMIVKEGSTFVPEIIEKLDTYANYIVYVRAVTSGQVGGNFPIIYQKEYLICIYSFIRNLAIYFLKAYNTSAGDKSPHILK